MRQTTGHDFPIIVAAMPINTSQRRAALVVIVLLFTVAAASVPFAQIYLGRLDVFIPVLQAVICIAELITAFLLFSQYSAEPRPAILVLACGYIASGMFAFLQTLAFPGGYGPDGVIGNGVETSSWLFVWWHTFFPAAIFIYALSKDQPPTNAASWPTIRFMIGVSIVCTLFLIAALTLVATVGIKYLPILDIGSRTQQANLFLLFLYVPAFFAIFLRRRTVLDLWLIVILLAWMSNFFIAALVMSYRFSVPWYAARGIALFASCILLAVLLAETTVLHLRLTNAITSLRRERANRLMTLDAATGAMAHEIRQPLTGIVSSSAAGLNWLKATPPELEKVQQCLAAISSSGHRANEIISSVREMFKSSANHRSPIQLNNVALQVLNLMHEDLQRNEISVATEFQQELPDIHADRTQLQQAILNLVRNAIEAMEASPLGGRKLRLATWDNGHNSVLLSVQDSGPGMTSVAREKLFDAFFTTKPRGMGLGLLISQNIVNEHGGELQLVKADSNGCLFEMILPRASATDSAV